MKKQLFFLCVVLLLAMPIVLAEGNNTTESCSIFSLMQCLKDTAYLITYSTGLAAQPLIKLIEKLMIQSPAIQLFNAVWLGITGIISIFYIFFMLYSGITFIIHGENIAKRYEAKESMKNMIIALILVASSFYLYQLLADFNTSLTSYIFAQINPAFFTVTSDNIGGAILQIITIVPYILTLFITVLLFLARYLFASFGIIFFPLAIFMYFIPFLRSYGKLLLNIIFVIMFVPFISSIIILGASMLATGEIFGAFSILFYTAAFLIIDFIFFLMIKFVIGASGVGSIAKTAIAVGKYFI